MSSGDLIGDAILGTIFVVDLHSGTNLLARDSNGLRYDVQVCYKFYCIITRDEAEVLKSLLSVRPLELFR